MTIGELYNYDKFGKFCVQYIREFNDLIFNTFVCYIFFAEELTDLVHNLQASEQVICQVWSALVAANEAGSNLTEMITEYTREAQTGRKLLKTLINIYEA